MAIIEVRQRQGVALYQGNMQQRRAPTYGSTNITRRPFHKRAAARSRHREAHLSAPLALDSTRSPDRNHCKWTRSGQGRGRKSRHHKAPCRSCCSGQPWTRTAQQRSRCRPRHLVHCTSLKRTGTEVAKGRRRPLGRRTQRCCPTQYKTNPSHGMYAQRCHARSTKCMRVHGSVHGHDGLDAAGWYRTH